MDQELYNGSLWVASGRGGNHVAYSYDGINWNAGGIVSTHSGRDINMIVIGKWFSITRSVPRIFI